MMPNFLPHSCAAPQMRLHPMPSGVTWWFSMPPKARWVYCDRNNTDKTVLQEHKRIVGRRNGPDTDNRIKKPLTRVFLDALLENMFIHSAIDFYIRQVENRKTWVSNASKLSEGERRGLKTGNNGSSTQWPLLQKDSNIIIETQNSPAKRVRWMEGKCLKTKSYKS